MEIYTPYKKNPEYIEAMRRHPNEQTVFLNSLNQSIFIVYQITQGAFSSRMPLLFKGAVQAYIGKVGRLEAQYILCALNEIEILMLSHKQNKVEATRIKHDAEMQLKRQKR